MALDCQRLSLSFSSSNALSSQKLIRTCVPRRKLVMLDHLLFSWGYLMKRSYSRFAFSVDKNMCLGCRLVEFTRSNSPVYQSRMRSFIPLASADDNITVNGGTQVGSSNYVKEMKIKLDQSLQGEDYNNGLIQSLHDAARVFELAIKDHPSSSKLPWLSTAWLGVDNNGWVKALSYQASVFSLLQAATEISSRGNSGDRDVNIFVHKSLVRQSAPLESVVREKLSAKEPDAYNWFWSEQVPAVVTTFINYFERDPRFSSPTASSVRGLPSNLANSLHANDVSLLMLALRCMAAITKLGPTNVSCPQFFSMVPEITGSLLGKLVDVIPIRQAYSVTKDIGLLKEYLVYFGPRAAAGRGKTDLEVEETVFWVGLVQKQLQQAIDRERIWSRLTTCESIEVLEKDLAIFGFFIALGRSTKSFLHANGFNVMDASVEGFLRYLIGGSVLYYPQLSSISSYQLYVEVVCEELEWLPFYPGFTGSLKSRHVHNNNNVGPPNSEALLQVLDVCSHWIQSFIKYSNWLQNPSNIKAAQFLSYGHNKLQECMEDLGMQKYKLRENNLTRNGSQKFIPIEAEADSFDQVLESVEGALLRLEQLLQELHVSSSGSGKEHLEAACSDLERIRKLKKEAEFLEASVKAKAASLLQVDEDAASPSSIIKEQKYSDGQGWRRASVQNTRNNNKSQGLWNFLVRQPTKKSEAALSSVSGSDDDPREEKLAALDAANLGSNEIQRFKLLRDELIELEQRVQRSTNQSENDETSFNQSKTTQDEVKLEGGSLSYAGNEVSIQKREGFIQKSVDKLKEASTDVFQGTQLLAIDVAAATGLLRRVIIGDQLTGKEKKALRRTLTDLASVVPIGFLMLLPVTAVGHAAILAAIQRYMPALIPSTYGSERLDLLRALEKVKELQSIETLSIENTETPE
ncbi:uncharacterized protein LOC124936733 [Impatiens glandulifera]|uniref:uncharacterized protein LOC124936733 n=1 Tax=Impatiens glandulifera TaxID=253017 RepID=UPI001FB0C66C|nr:uncharacterized protein LOC124936733 [Impatiens glandulifera]